MNPALAILLGAWFADEKITGITVTAMLIILTGVVLVILGQRK